jgi:photosystem II stability/assembly factor-like uncharacterized protein
MRIEDSGRGEPSAKGAQAGTRGRLSAVTLLLSFAIAAIILTSCRQYSNPLDPIDGTWLKHVELGQHTWTSIAFSADGSRAAATAANGPVFTSADRGMTWTQSASAGVGFWQDIACSFDGSTLLAVKEDSNLYISADGGGSWSMAATPTVFSRVACSSSAHVIACVGGSSIYRSVDGGSNWEECIAAGNRPWSDIAVSADGWFVVASYLWEWAGDRIVTPGGITISADGGSAWRNQMPRENGNFECISVSSDGGVVATVGTSDLFLSTDFGYTWTSQRPGGDENWVRVGAMSADGSVHLILSNRGAQPQEMNLFLSFSSGSGWTGVEGPGPLNLGSYVLLACAGDGSIFAAGESGGFLYTFPSAVP